MNCLNCGIDPTKVTSGMCACPRTLVGLPIDSDSTWACSRCALSQEKMRAAERERDALRDVALVAAEAVARWKGGDGSFNEIMSDLGVALERVPR